MVITAGIGLWDEIYDGMGKREGLIASMGHGTGLIDLVGGVSMRD